MDDIIIRSQTLEELRDATPEVLQLLQDNRLFIAHDTSEWAPHQIKYLGYIISGQGVEMMHEKVDTLKRIEPVKILQEVQHFLGFANFYRPFIKDYSKIILPIINSISL